MFIHQSLLLLALRVWLSSFICFPTKDGRTTENRGEQLLARQMVLGPDPGDVAVQRTALQHAIDIFPRAENPCTDTYMYVGCRLS